MAIWDRFTNAVGNVVNTAKNAVSSANSAAKKAVDTAAKTVQNAQTATKTAVKTATKNALSSATNTGKTVSQNIADIARGKTTTSANGTWSIATATGATAGALGGIASGVKTATTTPKGSGEKILQIHYNTSSKNGISNAADALLTDISWEPVYVSNSKDGSKNTQTWVNTYTGDQKAFAGISASALSDYYEEKGDTKNARIMDSIARASTRYDSLNTAGYRYDNMGSIGSVLGVSSSPASSLYGTSGTPTASTPKESSGGLSSAWSTIRSGATAASNILDNRDTVYEAAGAEVAKGNIVSGQVVGGAATLTADVLLPLDLANVASKVVSGKADELTGWDVAFAALDTVAILATPFTGGLSYVGLKGAKTAAKGIKTASYAGQVGLSGASLFAGV